MARFLILKISTNFLFFLKFNDMLHKIFFFFLKMVLNMKDIMKWVKNMGKVFLPGQMDLLSMENFKIILHTYFYF